MKFESLIEAAGGLGRHQIYMLIWNQLIILLLSSNVLFMIFGMYDKVPAADCVSKENHTEWSNSPTLNETLGNRTICFPKYFYSPTIEWGLTSNVAKGILTIQMFGVFLGPTIFGQAADLWGRKLMLTIALIIQVIVGGLSAACPTWQWFAAARFFLGVFSGGVGILHHVIMFEVVLPQHRLLVQIGGWPIGYMWTAGLAAMFRTSWRQMLIASNVFGLIPILMTFLLVFESPKWLLEKKRYAEAKEVLVKIANRNGVGPGAVEKIYEERHGVALLDDKDAPPKKVYSYWHLFRNKTAAIHTIGLMLVTFTTSTLSYTITFSIKDLAGDPCWTTFIFGLLRLPLTLLVPYLDRKLEWLGRRLSLQIGLFGASSCFTVLTILYFTDAKANQLMIFKVFSLGSAMLAGIVWMTVSLYCAELFPTALRSMGMAMNGFAARIGNLVSPALMILGSTWSPLPYMTMSLMGVACMIFSFFFLPETKGHPLPDIDDKKSIPLVVVGHHHHHPHADSHEQQLQEQEEPLKQPLKEDLQETTA